MNTYSKKILKSILSLPRYAKRAIIMFNDAGMCIICTWIALTLRLEELILFKDFNFYLGLLSVIIFIPIFWFFGLYRTVFRFFSSWNLYY